MSELTIPELCLVVLIGVSGSGKSTFARRAFGRWEVVSSDTCRAMVANDPADQSASGDAFGLLNTIVGTRLKRGLLTVVDATSVNAGARKELLDLAKAHDVLPVAIVIDTPEKTCVARNAARTDWHIEPHVVRRQAAQLRKSLGSLRREGFRTVHVLRSEEEIEAAHIVRTPLVTDKRGITGPFDIIGDIHGCMTELVELLDKLGYAVVRDGAGNAVDATAPEGRTAIFLGDLVDRGPDTPGVLRLVMGMVEAGHALAVPGNHEQKLVRALEGKQVQISHGLGETLAQLQEQPPQFRDHVLRFCRDLVSHLILDGGNLVVAHAGLKEEYQGRASGRVRAFALYGDTTGESDEYGLPVRLPWANDYRGRAMVVYGHTPTLEPEWVNRTICIDTGCVFGGSLTALRYPEKELVQVPAHQVYSEPVRPLAPAKPQRDPGVLDIDDVLGRRAVLTADMGRVTIPAENAAGALEVMSRFATDPRALIYLPPTMSPCATSHEPGYLEYPTEAFAGFAADGVRQVICEEKHMGSRAVVVLCQDPGIAQERFGLDGLGTVYTRRGRAFFDAGLQAAFLERLGEAATQAGLWNIARRWAVLDCELLPWSLKAGPLLREQYGQVGAAALASLPVALATVAQAQARGLDAVAAGELDELATRTAARYANAQAYVQAYERYAWPTDGLAGVQVAPFQLLAGDGEVFARRGHAFHLDVADALVAADPSLVRATRRLVVDTGDPASAADGVDWWLDLTGAAGEGMVVKPLDALVRGSRGLVLPGVKVRGREYLRIIYGPDYTEDANLERLRNRNLSRKRSLALREYALGLTALDRAAAGAPLHEVHEAVFAVLALESEPVDPRL